MVMSVVAHFFLLKFNEKKKEKKKEAKFFPFSQESVLKPLVKILDG
jgi:hypothetical protein